MAFGSAPWGSSEGRSLEWLWSEEAELRCVGVSEVLKALQSVALPARKRRLACLHEPVLRLFTSRERIVDSVPW